MVYSISAQIALVKDPSKSISFVILMGYPVLFFHQCYQAMLTMLMLVLVLRESRQEQQKGLASR